MRSARTEILVRYDAAGAIRHGHDLNRVREAMHSLFPDMAALEAFVDDAGKLTFPGSYGESPFDRAFSIAFLAVGRHPVTNLYVIDSDDYFIAMEYRRNAGLSTSRDARGNIVELQAV